MDKHSKHRLHYSLLGLGCFIITSLVVTLLIIPIPRKDEEQIMVLQKETSLLDVGEGDNWYDTNFSYRKLITIDPSFVHTTLTDFPILVYNSSDVQLNANAQVDGDDIFFVDYYDNSTKYNHEIEVYSSGSLSAWVNVTTVRSGSDTKLWMYYGNSTCDSQEDIEGTWNVNYTLVHHFEEPSGLYNDSTQYRNNATSQDITNQGSLSGVVGYCADFEADNTDFITHSDANSLDLTNFVVELWADIETVTSDDTFCGKGTANHLVPYMRIGSDLGFRITDKISKASNPAFTEFHYLCMGYDTTTDYIAIYKDGIHATLATNGSSISLENNANDFHLGKNDAYANEWLDAQMDEFRVSNTRRNISWINATFNTVKETSSFITLSSQESMPSGITWQVIIDNINGSYFNDTNDVPQLIFNSPVNNSVEQSTSPLLNITVEDNESNTMNVSIYSINDSEYIEQWNDISNSTLTYRWWTKKVNTTYNLWVNVTDSTGQFVNKTWVFTTNETNLNTSAELWEDNKTYYIVSDILEINSTSGFIITGDNITVEGQEYTLSGTDTPWINAPQGFKIYNVNNVTVKNVYANNWTVGIDSRNSENITIENFYFTNPVYDKSTTMRGIYFENTKYMNIYNCSFYDMNNTDGGGGSIGIYYYDINVHNFIHNCSFDNITVDGILNYGYGLVYTGTVSVDIEDCIVSNCSFNNSEYGIYVSDSINCIYSNSTITNNTYYGFYIASGVSFGVIYNNYFNNTENFNGSLGNTNGSFNISEQLGQRIYSAGTNIGGNYWANPSGTGYSQIASDDDYDGFCDDAYLLFPGGIGYQWYDFLPYSDNYSLPFQTIISNINGSYTNTTVYHVLIESNGSYSNTTSFTNILEANGSYYNISTLNTTVDNISPYDTSANPLTITATSTGATPDNVSLYYRYSSDNVSWGGGFSYFGNTTSELDNNPIIIDYIAGSVFTPSNNGTVDNITAYIKLNSGSTSNNVRCGIYNNDTGDFIAGTEDKIITNDIAYEHITFNFSVGPSIENGVNYLLCAWGGNSSDTIRMSSVDKATINYFAMSYDFSANNGVFPSTFSLTTPSLAEAHIYCNYTITDGSWASFGIDTASPWSWSFNFPNSTGYYQFYSIAQKAGLETEAIPVSADTSCNYTLGINWQSILEVNGSYSNSTSFKSILESNGSYVNTTSFRSIIGSNGSYSNTTSFRTLLDANGSYLNTSAITWQNVLDVNGSYSNSTSFKNILNANGSYQNNTSFREILNSNGSYSNNTIWRFIFEANGTYSNTSGLSWQGVIDNINGSYDNTSEDGKNFYVSNSGADSNNGTHPDTPWENISNVVTALGNGTIVAGDNIWFNRGDTFNDAQLDFDDGVAGVSKTNPMIIGAYGSGAKPIMSYNSVTASIIMIDNTGIENLTIQDLHFTTNQFHCILSSISGSDYFKNLTVRRCDFDNLNGAFGLFLRHGEYYKIENCTFDMDSTNDHPIAIGGTPALQISNGIIRNCTMTDCKDGINIHYLGDITESTGPNLWIENCTISNWANGESGIDLSGGENSSNILVKNCEFKWGGGNGAIWISWGTTNVVIDNVYIHDVNKSGIGITSCNNTIIRYCVVDNWDETQANVFLTQAGNLAWTNNTVFYNNDGIHYGDIHPVSGESDYYLDFKDETDYFFVSKNNIYFSTHYSQPNCSVRVGGMTFETLVSNWSHNIWWRGDNGSADETWWTDSGSTHTFAQWQSALFTTGEIRGDPELADIPTANYSLNSTSPAIDAGAWLNKTSGTGEGYWVTVDESNFFFAGLPSLGIEGDNIFVGNDTDLVISEINHANNSFKVNRSVTWLDDENVSLSSYNGSAPDIGAKESGVSVGLWDNILNANGSYTNTTTFRTLFEVNGSYQNTTSYRTILESNGSYSNTTQFRNILDANGSYSNGTSFRNILEANGTYSNTSVKTWQSIIEVNGSYNNGTSFKPVLNANGSYQNTTSYRVVCEANGSYANTTSFRIILDANGSYNNGTSFHIILEANGSYSNTSILTWQTILTVNGSYSNTTSFRNILNANGSYYNSTIWHLILESNGSYYNTSIPFNNILDANGSYSNSTTMKTILTANGSYYNSTAYHILLEANGSYYNGTSFRVLFIANGSYYNISIPFKNILEANGSYYNTSFNIYIDNEYPANRSSITAYQPQLTFNVTSPSGHTMNYTLYIDNTTEVAVGKNVANGTQSLTNHTFYTATDTYEDYYWRVMLTDGHGQWINDTFDFMIYKETTGGMGYTPSLALPLAIALIALLVGVFAMIIAMHRRKQR